MTLPAVTIGFIKVKFPLTSVQGVGKENWAWSGLQNFEQGKRNPLQHLTLHIGF